MSGSFSGNIQVCVILGGEDGRCADPASNRSAPAATAEHSAGRQSPLLAGQLQGLHFRVRPDKNPHRKRICQSKSSAFSSRAWAKLPPYNCLEQELPRRPNMSSAVNWM